MLFEIDNLSCGYKGTPIVQNINFSVTDGEVVCLLGPNGVGKTTFFKTAQGFLPAITGKVTIEGKSILELNRRDLAKRIAYVPQIRGTPFPFRVLDMVLMGRVSYINRFSGPGPSDHKICEKVIEQLGIQHLRDKFFTRISGGEQQLVLIARALAQEPRLLLMDEPTSNLDFSNQIAVLSQIMKLSQQNISILMITHFPDHAFICANKVVLFTKEGNACVGTTEDILTEETLMNVYGVAVKLSEVESGDGDRIKTFVPILRRRESR